MSTYLLVFCPLFLIKYGIILPDTAGLMLQKIVSLRAKHNCLHLEKSVYLPPAAACVFSTFLTIFCSSIRKARTILKGGDRAMRTKAISAVWGQVQSRASPAAVQLCVCLRCAAGEQRTAGARTWRSASHRRRASRASGAC